jgi:hypothetical protein
VGDFYHVLVTLEPGDDITISEMNLIVDSIEVETTQVLPSDAAENLMQS